MKKETYQNKLAELLGLGDKFKVEKDDKKKKSNIGAHVGLTDEQIEDYRFAQSVSYFLQAPELFSAKVCPHCKESFLVSRPFVQFCSYTCIRKDLESKGLGWNKGNDIEALVRDVYDGNEPLWIKNLPALKSALEKLTAMEDKALESPSLLASARG